MYLGFELNPPKKLQVTLSIKNSDNSHEFELHK